MAENIPESVYFPHDREQLMTTLARFDDGLKIEDVVGPENEYDNLKKHSNTVLIQVLLEFICHAFVKDENHKEKLLLEACKRLSRYKILNDLLIMDDNQVRRTMKSTIIKFLKQICDEIIPAAEINTNALQFFQTNCLSTDLKLQYCTNFIELNKIAAGGFGSVYKVRNKLNKLIYAVKKIPFDCKTDANFLMVMREASNFAALSHLNIVRYYNAWIEMCDSDVSKSSKDNVDSDSNMEDMTEAYSGFVVTGKPSGGRSNELSERDEKNLHSNSNSTECDYIIFSESAELSSNVKFSVGNYSEHSSDYSDENARNESDWFVENNSENFSDHSSEDSGNEYSCSVENNELHSDHSKKDTRNKSDCHNNFSFSNFKMQGVLYIQMEYCDCDLRYWLDRRAVTKGKELPFEMDVAEIFTSIVNGVAHIHSKGIIHRDLKPRNIFYSQSCNTVKIGDFGLATLFETTPDSSNYTSRYHSSGVGTLPYSAPEQRKSKKYDMKVDIYSLGIILIELINICTTGSELCHIIEGMKAGKIKGGSENFPILGNLAGILINENPENRMSAKEILDFIGTDSKEILKEVIKNEFEEVMKEKDEMIKEKDEIIQSLLKKVEDYENKFKKLDDKQKKIIHKSLQKIQ